MSQVWIHSHEEDSADVRAYREQEFDFPPSRGREGFQINADSTFVFYAIAPTDGSQKKKAQWTLEDEKLRILFKEPEHAREDFFLEFISLENGLLRAKKTQNER